MIQAFVGGIGAMELIIVLVIILLLFGAKKLPELARSMGRGVSEFKGGLNDKPHQIESAKEEPELGGEDESRVNHPVDRPGSP